ncbi:MAG: M48 family metalloprotease [Candidatus Gastranaerophilales bacterium]|nr:M48 family metalloprotease [Candidatus Gastranaerophilales bacterium]
MKKVLLLLALLCTTLAANAATVYVQNDVTNKDFWERTGVQEKKVTAVANKIISANKLKGRAPVTLKTDNVINALANLYTRNITVLSGSLSAMDNDDELAYLLSHEIAHSMETYESPFRVFAMKWMPKKYEFKADLVGIDYMVKAGYNPVAAIAFANKTLDEPYWDWYLSHPKGSRRLFEMYKHIYTKYPEYLSGPMVHNVNYINYINSNYAKIKGFEQKQKNREMQNNEKL